MFGFDLVAIIKTAGYAGLFAIIFAESGLLIGFFLPGDSLLFTAGVLASQGYLNIAVLAVIVTVAAILGDSVGYAFGQRIGNKIFYKEDSFFFNKRNIQRAHEFFQKHGRKTIILARFLPVVRTFVPILAGVGEMHYKTFLSFNVIGGLLWGCGLTFLGYFFGNIIPDPDRYLIPAVAVIIIISVLPAVIHLLRDPETRAHLAKLFRLR